MIKICSKCGDNFKGKGNSNYCEKCKTKKCLNCGKDIYNIKNIFCSKICKCNYYKGTSLKPKTEKKIFICQTCGKEFIDRISKKRKFCSHDCASKQCKPKSKKGMVIKCITCGNHVYKPKSQLKTSKNFCSLECANNFQKKNKIELVCKTCAKYFLVSPSKKNMKFCSIECRNNNKEHMLNVSILANKGNINKNGLNKLELKGSEILKEIGIEYKEQVLMFNKFLVDVLIESKKLIIQWDGIYWHSKPQRRLLDKSQDAYFLKAGYKVLRITDLEIKTNINKVYENIRESIQ